MRILAVVLSEQLRPKLVHLRKPGIQLLAAKIKKEVAAANASHKTATVRCALHDRNPSAAFSQAIGCRQTTGTCAEHGDIIRVHGPVLSLSSSVGLLRRLASSTAAVQRSSHHALQLRHGQVGITW